MIAKAVELSFIELGVDHLEHWHPRLALLCGNHVAERAKCTGLDIVEKANGRRACDPRKHHRPRRLIPVLRLCEDVIVGIAPAHLRRRAAALVR